MPDLNLFDYFVLTYLAWGWIRGSWRGLYTELYGIISALLVLALLSGYGLTSSVWHLISSLNQHTMKLSGVTGYFLLILITLFVLWRIHRRLRGLRKGEPTGSSTITSILGVSRAALWSLVFVSINSLLPLNLFERLFIKQSSTLALLQPVLEFIHVAK